MNENLPKTEGQDASHDRYDFQRLERSVEYLLDEHMRLGAEREALLAELADREHRVAQLEAEVLDERRLRAVAVEGVDKVLSRLEQLQARVGYTDQPDQPDQQSASGATR